MTDSALETVPRRPEGLARRPGHPDGYAVLVVAHDVGDAVGAAGGWMVDRLRAGWRVCVMTPEDSDETPLRILGVATRTFDATASTPALMPLPASFAVSSELLKPSNPLAAQVRAMTRDLAMEVTVWGKGDIDVPRSFAQAQYRPSRAAQAFKAHALRSASCRPAGALIEAFRSSAPWYPLDHGADLESVPHRGAGRRPQQTR